MSDPGGWASPDTPASQPQPRLGPGGPARGGPASGATTVDAASRVATPGSRAPGGPPGTGPGGTPQPGGRYDHHALGVASAFYNAVGVRLPVPLHPMSVADVLDGTFAIIKAKPRTVLGISGAVLLPLVLLQAYLQRDLIDTSLMSPVVGLGVGSAFATPSADSGVVLVGVLVVSLAFTFANFIVGGAIARLVSAWYAGGDLTAGAALAASFRRIGALGAAWALWLPAAGVSAFLSYCLVGLPPFLAVLTLSTFLAPVIVVERLGPIQAISRSARLAWKRFFPILGILLLGGLMVQLATVALSAVGGVLALFAISEQSGLAVFLSSLLSGFVLVLSVPVATGISVLLYIDQRVRAEGLDLELAVAELAGSPR